MGPSIVLAHPVTEAAELGVAPAFVALLAVALIGVAAGLARRAPAAAAPSDAPPPSAPAVPARPAARPGPLLGAVLLVIAVAAGRVGDPDQFDNLAPALVVGFGWPALLLVTAVAGDVWRHVNPFAGLALVVEALAGGRARAGTDGRAAPGAGVGDGVLDGVAVVGALCWAWWLAVHTGGLDPRAIGLGLGAYALVTAAGCLAVGRARWLHRAELLTVVLGALAAARRGPVALSTGHRAAMAVLLGGLAFAELRYSRWYLADVSALGLDPGALPVAAAGFAVAVALGVLTTAGAARLRVRLPGAVPVDRVLPWLVVGVALAAAVERDRLWTSAQLVVARLSDPLGTGLDLIGTADLPIRIWPFGPTTRLAVQLVVLVAPVVVGVVLALRQPTTATRGRGPQPAVGLAAGWVLLAALSAATL